MLELHTLQTTERKTKKRVGRGWGSRGKYSGRGMKGQKARSGGKGGLKLRGAKQTILRLPKNRGFKSPRASYEVVNVADLELFDAKAEVTPQAMVKKGLIPSARMGVKVLGDGALSKALTVHAHAFSASAKNLIEKAGGKAEVIETVRKKGAHPKGEKVAKQESTPTED